MVDAAALLPSSCATSAKISAGPPTSRRKTNRRPSGQPWFFRLRRSRRQRKLHLSVRVAARERFYDWCAGKQRDARKKMRESSVFAELNKDDKDIEPLLSAMGLTRAQAVSEYAAFTTGLLHLVLQHRLN